jgi:class II lanthipeptide synthase
VSVYREQIVAALGAAGIRDATRYTWLGQVSRALPSAVEAAMDGSARNAHLVSSLAHELYWSFYCRGRPVPARWGEPGPIVPDGAFAEALSEANTGNGSWEGGWTVERIEGETALIVSSVRARVPTAACRSSGALRAGAAVDLRVPKEHLWLAPGFYTAFSNAAVRPAGSVLRAYWNVTATGAPLLVHALTTTLNGAETPFRLKIADHPFRLDRCDAAVLYLPDTALEAVRSMLLAVADELAAHLTPSIPTFTLALAPGVGLAEHDGGPVSFGTLRCRLLAEAIVRAADLGTVTPDERLASVAEHFAEAGVDIDAPYREPSLAGAHVL